MWVILKESIKGDYETLAIHLETFNGISIMNLDKKFHLVVQKYFDGHQSNQSNMHCPLLLLTHTTKPKTFSKN